MPTSRSSELKVPGWPETPDEFGAYPRLSDEQILKLSRYGERRSVPQYTVLFCEGDRDCDLFVVLSGSVAVVEETDGDPRPIAVHGPGRFVGDMAQLTGQTVLLTAVAQEDTEVLAVPVERLPEVATDDPGLGDFILRGLMLRRSLHLGIGSGFRIIGSRFSSDTRRLRDFMSRNRIPHRWIDLEEDPEADAILKSLNVSRDETPVVIWKGQRVLRNPSIAELASLMGLREAPASHETCDMVVVGAGPAGLAAAVYGASEGLSTVVVDAVATGGQAATSSQIENYLGFPAGVSGAELADRAVVQARKFGATFTVPGQAVGLELADGHSVVQLDDGSEVTAHTVIVATGTHYKRLEAPGVDRLEAASVYYAATPSEAQICGGDPVTVVGGGNSAGQAAVFLSRTSPAVNLVIRHDDLYRDMSSYLADRVLRTPKIHVCSSSEVCELVGETVLESVVICDLGTGERHSVDSVALFVLIGSTPNTAWLQGQVPLDDKGFVITGRDGAGMFETRQPGVLAVGDVRSGSVKRVAAAVGDGSIAVRHVHTFLAGAGHG
jgi:thioredoxin reductase (NADPH)